MTEELWAMAGLVTLSIALCVWAALTGEPARMPRHFDPEDETQD